MNKPLILLSAFIFGLFILLACKKQKGPSTPKPTDYTTKMARKLQWRIPRLKSVVDSNGDTTFVQDFLVVPDSILVFSSTKVALASSVSLNGRDFDTFYFVGSNADENTIRFAESSSTKYYSSESELKYNYVTDTFVIRTVRWDAFPPPGVDSVVSYAYSP